MKKEAWETFQEAERERKKSGRAHKRDAEEEEIRGRMMKRKHMK